MFEKGQIVYHDQVIFNDSVKDVKNKRPCVVLFSVEYDGNNYVCTCPFISQIKSFNKNPNIYQFIPEQIYQYKKLSFAKLDSIRLYPLDETHETPYVLDEKTVDSIINGFNKMNKETKQSKIVKYFLEYDKLFSELEQRENNKVKKLERNNKRREAKRFV